MKKNLKLLSFVFGLLLFITFQSVSAVPDPPTNLTAVAKPQEKIRLDWDAPPGKINGYQIERESPVGGGWQILVADTGDKKIFYTDSGLQLSTEYNYRVRAIDNTGISLPSNTASANTGDAGIQKAPTPPRDLRAVGANNQVTLTWTEPNPRGSPITDYILEYSPNNGRTWNVFEDGTSTRTAETIRPLLPDHYYLFRVYAVNDIGVSDFSEILERTYNEEKKARPAPKIEGIGFYKFDISPFKTESKTIPYHNLFSLYFPYSAKSDLIDLENYGQGKYEKFGLYYALEDVSTIHGFSATLEQPVQLQIRLSDLFASSRIEHLSLFIDNSEDLSMQSSNVELIFDKGQPLDLKDKNQIIKDAQVSTSIEDGQLWVIFDLKFQKPMEKSGIILQTWNEFREPSYVVTFDAIEILSNDPDSEFDKVDLTAEVEVTHGASNPTCKINNSCFTPYNAEILETGIVTWSNTDSLTHTVTSGSVDNNDNRFGYILFPGQTAQHKFPYKGIYNYYCALHPWATGSVTVYGKDLEKPEINFDESKSALLVKSTSGGSLIIENDDVFVTPSKDLHMDLSGHIQELSTSNIVKITIIHPDETLEQMTAIVNNDGFYSLPVVLNKHWLEGTYEIITEYRGEQVAQLSFLVSEKLAK